MESADQTFRPPYLMLFGGLFILGSLFAAVLMWALVASGQPLPGVISYTFLRVLCIVYLWAAVCAFVMMKVLTVTISDSDLQGRNALGKLERISWDAVQSVKRIGPRYLGFLRVVPRTGESALWLPLFVRHSEA